MCQDNVENIVEKLFKTIGFYYLNRAKEFTKLAFRKAFPGKPDNILFRKKKI